MEITYIGHAGFLVETPQFILVMDPWLSPEGAFDSAWFQFPCNHDLAPFVREKLQDGSKARYVYVSHEHHDHFDPNFLKTLPGRDITFLIPHFQRAALRTELGELHPKALVTCSHGQEVNLPGGTVKLYLDDSGINRDSGIIVKSGGETFLNLNDCKLYDELATIARTEGPISVLTCQFSGATWHPTCYEYAPEEYRRISSHKLRSKFEMVARAIQTIQPKVYVPSAGPACFLDPTLLHLNFQPVNIFPRAPQLMQFLHERLGPQLETRLVEMMPGDVFDSRNACLERLGKERVTEDNFENYIRSYAARYSQYFADRQPLQSDEESQQTLRRLRSGLERKLSAFELHDRIRLPLYFGLSDAHGKLLRIDFPRKAVDPVSRIADLDYYSLFTPSWQIERVLDGTITWEEFALTFRIRLNRKPDVYQTLMQGFLLMEPEDMNWFCARLLDIEQRQKRIIVEAGGIRYSIDRYCPHQGADLSQGWLSETGLWTCPRHRWQFALDKDGQCLTSNGSIHAVCLEQD